MLDQTLEQLSGAGLKLEPAYICLRKPPVQRPRDMFFHQGFG